MSANMNPSAKVTAIRLIDTCILCEILMVPGKSNEDEHKKHCKEFASFEKAGGRFVLPLATLIETGNHIAQNGDGNRRRQVATVFVKFVKEAMLNGSPFLKSEIWNAHIEEWIEDFPDNAMRGVGLGDCSIQKDLEIVKRTFGVTNLPVEIWTKDKHNA